MRVVLNAGQIDILTVFLANMAVAWFVGAFITPTSLQSLIVYSGYGCLSLIAALALKGGV